VGSFASNSGEVRPVPKGVDTRRVRISRDDKGYGLKITSHSDVRGIRVTHVIPDGAAARTGQLHIGDVILEVCCLRRLA
jgi:C-terminal processing protease CtpA/Prc